VTATRGGRWWWLLPPALLLGVVGWRAAAHPLLVGDSHGVAIGAQRIVDCLRHGQFTWCDRRPDGLIGGRGPTGFRPGAVGQFPLLQYVLAVPLRAIGLRALPTVRILILIDFTALLASIGLVWRLTRRPGGDLAAWGPVLVLTLIVSPMLWYSTVPFAEVLAIALLLGVVAGVLEGWTPLLLGLLVALACTTKETTPLFVVALGGLAFLARPESERTRAKLPRVAGPVLVGVLVGSLANVGFDVFRYDSLRNSTYLQAPYGPPGISIESRSFAALLVSPNGGLLWFWPAAVGVLAIAACAWPRPRRADGWRSLAPWAVLAVLVADLVGLALWYSPFGWIGWGPRLTLPLVPPLLVLAVVFAGSRGAALLSRVLLGPGVWIAGVVLTVAGSSQLAFLSPGTALQRFFHAGGSCVHRPIEVDPPAYYRCLQELAWQRRPILWEGLRQVATPAGVVATLAVVGAVAGLLALARREARPQVAPVDGPTLARHGVPRP
jgi:hypothetical protein